MMALRVFSTGMSGEIGLRPAPQLASVKHEASRGESPDLPVVFAFLGIIKTAGEPLNGGESWAIIGRGAPCSCLADDQMLPCGLDDFAGDRAEIIDVEDALDLGK